MESTINLAFNLSKNGIPMLLVEKNCEKILFDVELGKANNSSKLFKYLLNSN
jgi:hypothetical protein